MTAMLFGTGFHVTGTALAVLLLHPLAVVTIYREALPSQNLSQATAVSAAILTVLIVLNAAQIRPILGEGR